MSLKSRALNLAISLDQFLFCVITLGGSNPDETMSSAAYRLEQDGRLQGKLFRPPIDAIFLFLFSEKDHCRTSWEAEQK